MPVNSDVEVLGVITLENVIERILLTDINDEKDRIKLERSVLYQHHSDPNQTAVNQTYNDDHYHRSDEKFNPNFESSVDGEVFKSKFVQDYYYHLMEDI